MRTARLLVIVTLLVLPAGCIKPEPDPDRVVAGHVDGTSPTNAYLKVYLVNDTGYVALANFDRRDWYVTGLERAISEKRVDFAVVEGRDREIINEVVAESVLSPDDLNGYRFDAMEERATARGEPFDKAALDAEWDERLAELAEDPPPLQLPPLP